MASQQDGHPRTGDWAAWIGVITAIVGALGALIFNAFSTRATNKQIELTRQGQVGERFGRAIDQLGSDKLDVQLGGMYELEQLAHQANDRRLAIYEVLGAYIRNHPSKPPTSKPYQALSLRAPNVQTALTILARRNPAPDDPRLDLVGSTLQGAVVSGGTSLAGANLNVADLGGALLSRSDLHGANLIAACLDRAYLVGTDLQDAALQGADLRDAYLVRARLQSANLQGADLRGARLQGANLQGPKANLDGVNVRGSTADSRTVWPDGFDWKGRGVLEVRGDPGPPPAYRTRPPGQVCGLRRDSHNASKYGHANPGWTLGAGEYPTRPQLGHTPDPAGASRAPV